MTEIDVIDDKGMERTITKSNTRWMLFTGWMLQIIAHILNIVYYLIHPSSPEIGTWGAAEELQDKWIHPDDGEYECEKM